MQRGTDARPPSRRASRILHRAVGGGPALVETLERRQMLASYYVATDGNNDAAGSVSAPFKDLWRAIEVSNPGDVINLRQGTHAGGLYITENDITIQSFPGERAHIAAPIDDPDLFVTLGFNTDADNVTLRNLDISGGYNYSIKLESTHDEDFPEGEYDGTSGLLIEGCRVFNSGQHLIKISPECDDVTIRTSEIYNSGRRDATDGQGIDAVNADNLTVEDCYIHDTTQNGLFVKGGSRNATIQRNQLENIGWSGILLGQATSFGFFSTTDNPLRFESIDSVALENVVINAGFAGIAVWGSLNPRVQLNVIVNAASQGQAGILLNTAEHYPNDGPFFTRPSRNVIIQDNIVVQSNNKPMVQIRADAVEGFPRMSDNTYFNTTHAPQFWDERTIFKGSLAEWQALLNGDRGSRIAPVGLFTAAAATRGVVKMSPNGNQLTWSDLNDRTAPGSSVHTYSIYRGTTPDFAIDESSRIGTTTSLGFTDATSVFGQTYYYRVTVDNGSGEESRPSVAFTSDPSVPVLTSIKHRYLAGENTLLLKWQHVGGGGAGTQYNVYRGTTPDFVPGTANLLGTVSEQAYLDVGVSSFAPWYYKVGVAPATVGQPAPATSNVLGERAVSDIDGNGNIDADDEWFIDQHYASPDWRQYVIIDFTGNGTIDAADEAVFDANLYQIKRELLSDLNLDGMVNSADATLLAQVARHWYGADPFAPPPMVPVAAPVRPAEPLSDENDEDDEAAVPAIEPPAAPLPTTSIDVRGERDRRGRRHDRKGFPDGGNRHKPHRSALFTAKYSRPS